MCGVVVGEDPPAGPGWDKAGLIETVTSRHTNQTISSKTINILVLFQKTDQNEWYDATLRILKSRQARNRINYDAEFVTLIDQERRF